MTSLYTESEIGAIRHLVLETSDPDDSQLVTVSHRNPQEIRNLIRRYLNLLLDGSATVQKICSVFNSCQQKIQPRPNTMIIESTSKPPEPTMSIALPPKFRGKAAPPTIIRKERARIPMLPRCATSPSAVSRHISDHVDPTIGSLAAVLHPMLGPAHVCRVLSKRRQSNGDYYLVSFFQTELSPCYVPSEYLFQLESHAVFLWNEPEFRCVMESRNVSVDWLLERIFSSAQNLVINNSEVLFPPQKM